MIRRNFVKKIVGTLAVVALFFGIASASFARSGDGGDVTGSNIDALSGTLDPGRRPNPEPPRPDPPPRPPAPPETCRCCGILNNHSEVIRGLLE